MSDPPDPVNAAQAAGEHRTIRAALFDDEIRPHNERFRAAARVGPGIACSTSAAAPASPPGRPPAVAATVTATATVMVSSPGG
jgi:hypothetical protein